MFFLFYFLYLFFDFLHNSLTFSLFSEIYSNITSSIVSFAELIFPLAIPIKLPSFISIPSHSMPGLCHKAVWRTLLCDIGRLSRTFKRFSCRWANRSLARAGCGCAAMIVDIWVFAPRVMPAIRWLKGLLLCLPSMCGNTPTISIIATVATIICSNCGVLSIGVSWRVDTNSDDYTYSRAWVRLLYSTFISIMWWIP